MLRTIRPKPPPWGFFVDCRKDFTPSERVAIGEAIEEELRQRHGKNQHTKEEVENFPPPDGKTRDLVAKATGFGNGKTYEQAKKVTNEAAPRGFSFVWCWGCIRATCLQIAYKRWKTKKPTTVLIAGFPYLAW